MRIAVDSSGLVGAKLWFKAMGRNARTLYPLANKGLERWRESEQRTFASNVRWKPRKASTLRRYRWPIKTLNGRRMGRSKGRGVGFYTGGLAKALTKPHQPGIKDRAVVGRGKVSLEVGIKGGRQPRAYGRWFETGAGARPPRPVVTFDEKAARDLADDTVRHILPRGNR